MKQGLYKDVEGFIYLECTDKNTKSKHSIRIDTIIDISAASDGAIITTKSQQYSVVEDYTVITKRLFKQDLNSSKPEIGYSKFP